MEEKMLNLISEIKKELELGKNIIIGGNSENKSFIRNSVFKMLKEKNYAIFYGVSQYNYHNKINGKTLNYQKFWIEESDKSILQSIFEDYQYYEI